MKKKLIAVCIATLCCLTGCQNGGESSSSSDRPNDFVKMTTPYGAEDLQTVLFTDENKDLTVNVSDNQHLKSLLLSVEYYEVPEHSQENALADVQYTLTLANMELQIAQEGVVGFVTDSETTTALVVRDEFAYLATILGGDVISMDGYTATQTVEVTNAENKQGEITDKTAFLQSLSALRFVKLNNKAHYAIGDKGYTIKIDNDEIFVYQKYVVIGEELYLLCQGNFEFLGGITFGSSSTSSGGWLPWI